MLYELSKNTFEHQILINESKVLVDFWAPWCRPCFSLEPILEDLSDDLYGKISIYKLNVDEAPELADKYDIFNLPTLALFENGKLTKVLPGLQTEKAIKDWLSL